MTPTIEHIEYLWQQYVAGKATAKEVDELFGLLHDASADEQNMQLFHAALEKHPPVNVMEEDARLLMLQQILQTDKSTAFMADSGSPVIPPVHSVHFLRTAWFRYAAAILFALGILTYWWLAPSNKKQTAIITAPDVAPGKEGAVLTLTDGSTLVLDSMSNGVVASQGGVQLLLKNGQLAYNASTAGETGFNTLTTPKGRQFRLLLPDGSRVWLNAASSLRYPTAFNGNERKVEIKGEAYFEIVKDKARPFHVNVNENIDVEVLGTSFNINAYTDEPSVKTTLLEGSVRLTAGHVHPDPASGTQYRPAVRHNSSVMLKPGEQAQTGLHPLDQPNQAPVISMPDIGKVMAWKNGAFNFDDVSLRGVMRQLARWYDVEVIYEGNVPDKIFYGEMGRDLNLSQCLKVLETMQVHFRIEENKRLIVMP